MEIYGFIRPGNDAHTLGVSSIASLLEDCGYKVLIADAKLSNAITNLSVPENQTLFVNWLEINRVTRLGFSYRLEPKDAVRNFEMIYHFLKYYKKLSSEGGQLRSIYFAGLPIACEMISGRYNNKIPVFCGDETQVETLLKMDVPSTKIPNTIFEGSKYDTERFKIAQTLMKKGNYALQKPPVRHNYKDKGKYSDSLEKRLFLTKKYNEYPLFRVHVGPYNSNYNEAKKLFNSWLKTLSETGFLDIVSIGSSQLSQSNFGENWQNKPNGGGVPINSAEDLINIWDASRPMLLRTYAGTQNIPKLAEIYEKTINSAWHALSLWWFNQIDGRGPYPVLTNLRQHFETMDFIARIDKPFEPNIPHHFAFRGSDDLSYVISGYLAALLVKQKGIRQFVLQTMLNTPKATWGINDLAKVRALLHLVRSLEGKNFKVYLQPRAGLDYFSPYLEKAKTQLASVSMLMDDIEPNNLQSPDIIHVVSYCEAVELATPAYINESIQITMAALDYYRNLKQKHGHNIILDEASVNQRVQELTKQAKDVVDILLNKIPNLFTPEGFYTILKKGVFPVPYLWEGRNEFPAAIQTKTKILQGAVHCVDENYNIIDPVERVRSLF
jgi:hypothetical protein